MVRDFGSGLTVDELVGLRAWDIQHFELPPGDVFRAISQAAEILIEAGLGSHVLTELWEDGHTVWHSIHQSDPVVVRPTGQLLRRRTGSAGP